MKEQSFIFTSEHSKGTSLKATLPTVCHRFVCKVFVKVTKDDPAPAITAKQALRDSSSSIFWKPRVILHSPANRFAPKTTNVKSREVFPTPPDIVEERNINRLTCVLAEASVLSPFVNRVPVSHKVSSSERTPQPPCLPVAP